MDCGDMKERIALASGIAAAINPTQIVTAGIVYTDTPFLLFVAVSLYGALRWLRSLRPVRPAHRLRALRRITDKDRDRALYSGADLVSAGYCFAAADFCARHLGHAALIHPRRSLPRSDRVRNWSEHRAFALTAQGGMHLAYWVVPLVKEAKDGTPWERTAAA